MTKFINEILFLDLKYLYTYYFSNNNTQKVHER